MLQWICSLYRQLILSGLWMFRMNDCSQVNSISFTCFSYMSCATCFFSSFVARFLSMLRLLCMHCSSIQKLLVSIGCSERFLLISTSCWPTWCIYGNRICCAREHNTCTFSAQFASFLSISYWSSHTSSSLLATCRKLVRALVGVFTIYHRLVTNALAQTW